MAINKKNKISFNEKNNPKMISTTIVAFSSSEIQLKVVEFSIEIR